MSDTTKAHASFVESIPKAYDEFLGPPLFEPYARDLARRLAPVLGTGRLLELAAGTGIVTRTVRDALPPSVEIVATDLNQAMVDCGSAKFRAAEAVTWSVADAMDLPYPDGAFDAVICQFGVMFFPDKEQAFRECRRVLKPGGLLAFSVWDSMAENDLCRIAHAAIGDRFPDNPPSFYLTPFGFYDRALITSMLAGAGFIDISHDVISEPGESPSPEAAARGTTDGSPVSLEIRERDPRAMPSIQAAIANELRNRFGAGPIKPHSQAIVFLARTEA